MKYDFQLPVISIYGEPLREGLDATSKIVTFRDILINALLNYQAENSAEKLRGWDLACKIRDTAANCELVSEEVTLLKRAVDRVYQTGIYGPVVHLLEGGAALAAAE